MKVMMGLSGGVDSAVGAYLLQKQGYEVVGGFMRNWDALANNDVLGNPTLGEGQCPQEKDYWDAMDVAKRLGIPLLRSDFVKEYWDHVFTYFLSEYKKGRTPNPDVFCNKYIKFDSFLRFARSQGCERIAMGHYAGSVQDEDGVWHIARAKDLNKDQSYFLCELNADQIASCLFPLAGIEKPEVRKIAHSLDLETVMDKKDSTGVCFIGERNFKEFLQNYFPATPGDIVDGRDHKVVGRHSGVLYYTIGQRRGLGIGGISGEAEGSYFVYRKDVSNNILYVTKGEEWRLESTRCIVKDVNWVGKKPSGSIAIGAKFRYRQPDQPCVLHFEGDDAVVDFAHPIRSVTPGQIAAFYLGDMVLGGGIIDATYRGEERTDR